MIFKLGRARFSRSAIRLDARPPPTIRASADATSFVAGLAMRTL